MRAVNFVLLLSFGSEPAPLAHRGIPFGLFW